MTFKVPKALLNLVTPAQFDSSSAPATTSFVQRALGSYSGQNNYAVSTVLTSSDIGKISIPTANSLTFTLPLASSVVPGSIIYVGNPSLAAAGTIINTQGADGITRPDGSTGSITLEGADFATFRRGNSGTSWVLENSPAALKYMSSFGGSLAASGYQKLPSGLIIQWGTFTTSAAGASNLTLPIAFTSVCKSFTASLQLAVGANAIFISWDQAASTASNVSVYARNIGNTAYIAANTTYVAIGY